MGNKRRLAKVFQRMQSYYPEDFVFIPKTYCLPEQSQALEERMKTSTKTFIVKP